MKKTMVLALLLIGLASLGCISARASTHTNLIFNVSISLATFEQEFLPVATNQFVLAIRDGSFGTAAVASAIARSWQYQTNHLEGGKLLFRVSDLGTNRTAQFIIRKGTNDVDVSDLLNLSFPGSTVTAKTPGPNGTTNATDYITFGVNLSTTPAGYFSVQGFAITKNSSVMNGRDLIQAEEFPATITASVAGTGYSDGKKTFYKGTVLLSRRRVEFKED